MKTRREAGCDYCYLQFFRRAAEKDGLRVSVLPSVKIPGWYDIIVHPPTIDVENPGPNRMVYFRGRIPTAGERCECRRKPR